MSTRFAFPGAPRPRRLKNRAMPRVGHSPTSFVARHALPAMVALVCHAAVLFWPGSRSAPRGPHGTGGSTGTTPLELSFVERLSSEPASAAETPGASPAGPEPEAMPAKALAFTPPPPPAPQPDRTAPVDLALAEATLDTAAVTASLRSALPGVGRLQEAATSRSGRGAPGRPSPPRGDDDDDNLDLVELAQLDCEPALLRVPEFHFPAHLSRQGLHAGRVTVVVRVNASGRVSLLSVAESSHPDLVPAVCEAVAKALFQPPLRQGRRVALRYSWTLELKDRTQAPERRNS